MPRKRLIIKKKLQPDPIFNSTSVSRFTKMIMSDGKKRTAEKIIYDALEIMAQKNKADPLSMMEKRFKMLARLLKLNLEELVVQPTKYP